MRILFDWVYEMAEKSTERVRRWTQNNIERRRKMTNEAMARYRERHKDDPEYIEKRRESNKKASATFRKNIKTKSPEEYEAYREKERERLRRWRAAKKAAAAAAAAESKPED